jgi:hypothetical protein
MSYNLGDTVNFKINTTATAYTIQIYRMGYYAGMGARLVTTVLPSVSLPQTQPACLTDPTVFLYDCGNWAVSASWTIPTTATSGIYFARLTRPDTGGASLAVFVVRNDASTSDLLFQTSDTTWQAYDQSGGNSLYTGTNGMKADKVSYNRPTTHSEQASPSWVFGNEYPMVRWLEANGYNVSYFTDVDSDRNGSLIQQHRVFLSVGHDEYWSDGQRANVLAALAAGVNLAFFSGNVSPWKTRWENSIDGSNTSYRTLVTYKETSQNHPVDPADPPIWTGMWRDGRFSPPADGGRPENEVTGQLASVGSGANFAMNVPQTEGAMRFWRNTSAATLASGQTLTITAGCSCLLGYEWDQDIDNGVRPAGIVHLSSTTNIVEHMIQDIYVGSMIGPGVATHTLTLYKASSGALVFDAGTLNWAHGLDGNGVPSSTPDRNIQQATVNILADMGIQPGSLQSGLIAATSSTDTIPPTSQVTFPASGTTFNATYVVTIQGTAADTGGGVVGGVDVSTDGGLTWHPAAGLEQWSYTWSPTTLGTTTVQSRAVDDSGNIETPSAGVSVTVISPSQTATDTPTASAVVITATSTPTPTRATQPTRTPSPTRTRTATASPTRRSGTTHTPTLTPTPLASLDIDSG